MIPFPGYDVTICPGIWAVKQVRGKLRFFLWKGPFRIDMKRTKTSLLNLNPAELKEWFETTGHQAFHADQILSWIYEKGVFCFEDMSNLSKTLRQKLASQFIILDTELLRRFESQDGCLKQLLKLHDSRLIEVVYLPVESHYTLCLSSQVGCALGCRFCATGSMGIGRNLSVGEIISQVLEIQRDTSRREPGNIVFMGMGEPLLNSAHVLAAIERMTAPWGFGWSPRRITVSTAGIIPEIRRLGEAQLGINLAVSLNAADDRTRSRLMPINRKYPLKKLIQTLKEYPLKTKQQMITLEYILLKGINDSDDDAHKLTKLLARKRFKINLIAFNSTEGTRFKPSEQERILAFQQILSQAGLITRIRKSMGSDIAAACGQLAGQAEGESD
jgi:23S rRNA (adenine2503-C2)-methyltransferase